MHELAVVAFLFGDVERGEELAERYLLHQAVQQAKDAKQYKQHADALGYESFHDEEIERINRRGDQLVERFGRSFRNQYGWAVPLFDGNFDPNFSELEQVAALDHMRAHYGWASHRVHAGSKGVMLNVLQRGPTEVLLTGPTNIGLADPGHGALIALHQITTALLIHGKPNIEEEPSRIIVIQVLLKLVEEAGEAFLKVHRQIEAEEEHLWAEGGPEGHDVGGSQF